MTETTARVPMDPKAIEYIIDPVSFQCFLDDYYEKSLLVLNRSRQKHFQGLFDFQDLEEYLIVAKPWEDGSLRVFRCGKEAGLLDAKRLTFDSVARSFADGSTFVLNFVHTRWPALGKITAAIEAHLRVRVMANVYCTPPHSEGFSTHIDGHDVIVLQTQGRKRWRFFEQTEETPLDMISHTLRDHLANAREGLAGVPDWGQVTREVELNEGDTLYIPSGLPHSAATADSASIHVSVGLYPLRWHALIREFVDLLSSKDVRLRRAVPAGIIQGKEELPSLETLLEGLQRAAAGIRPEELRRLVEGLSESTCSGPHADLSDSCTFRGVRV